MREKIPWAEIEVLLRTGQKIQAIKAHFHATDRQSLMESKAAIDAILFDLYGNCEKCGDAPAQTMGMCWRCHVFSKELRERLYEQ